MARDTRRIRMDLYNDLRLVPGVLGVVEHFAQSAGLAPEEQQNLIAATQQACLDTFKLLPGEDGRLGVSILGLPDRIEIVLEHRGEALPSAGLDTFAALAAGSTAESDFAGLELMARVDRVLYHTEGGSSRMTLVKYVSPHAGSPAPQR